MTEQPTLSLDQPAESAQPTNEVWRKEIHARVAGYRNRRGRRIEGAFTMRFPFPVSEATESDAAPGPAAEPSLREIEVEEVVEDVQLSALPDRVAGEPVAEPAAIGREEFDALVAPTVEPEPEAAP